MKFSLLVFLLMLVRLGWSTELDSLRAEKRGKQWVVIHQVDPGETLYSISRRYSADLPKVIEVNEIQNNNIRSGQILEIPISDKINIQVPIVQPKKGTRTHTVATGETLSSISRKYGVKVSEIKNWNKLLNESLSIGQKLSIGRTARVESRRKFKPLVPFEGAVKHYVQSGENLTRISEMRNVSEDSLSKWNNLGSNNIKIGQILWYRPYDRSGEPVVTKEVFGKHTEEGIAMQIDDMENTDKYLALHKELPTGTLIEIRNLMNNKKVYVRVVGQLPSTGLNENILIRLTPISFKRMGILDARGRVELIYYDE